MHFQIELFKWVVDRLLYKFGMRDTCLDALDGNDENVRWPFNQCNRLILKMFWIFLWLFSRL